MQMQTQEDKIANLLREMTLEEKIALTIGRGFWTSNGVERLGIQPIVLTDGPHGVRKAPQGGEIGIGNSLPATCFPTAVSLASSWDTTLAEEIGQALGEESQALDVQVLLGPGVNIKRTPLGGRNFEYFSEDPVLAGEMGAAWVRGVQSQGVGTSLKHYACNNQEFERMTINAEVDQRTLRELYLPAFERVVKNARPATIMAAYNKVNGTYAAEHLQLLTEILKEEWGYEGVVVSDWGAVNDKAASLAAGLDLEMPGPGHKHTEKITQLVRQGQLSEEVIDRAAARVLKLILEGQKNRKTGTSFDKEAHHALARRAAAESIVLLKNKDNLLPLEAEKLGSLAVIGRFAAQPRYQGSGSSQMVPTKLDNTLEELRQWLSERVKVSYAEGYNDEAEAVDEKLLNEAVEQARQVEVALVFVGLPGSFESEGFDRQHIYMPQSHNRLIEEVSKVQPNTVVILHNGSVVAMPWIDGTKAILEVGLGGQAIGGAIVDVLSGKINPSGKLAETSPVKLEDTPAYLNYPGEAGEVRYGEGLFVGYRYYDKKKVAPLFPFGYGLSYTTFEYSDLKTTKAQIEVGEETQVEVTVKNSGTRAGKEIIQLYLQPLCSKYVRPEKELKAFTKIALEPGESRLVRFTLTEQDFRVYDNERQTWLVDGGSYRLVVGGSSDKLALSTDLKVKANPQTTRRIFTPMSPLKYLLEDQAGKAAIEQAVKGTGAEIWLSGGEIFTSMPIGKLATFGLLPEETIERIIAQINK